MRRASSQLCGATPMVRRNAREKWLTDKRLEIIEVRARP
jgi:hypothetical protein